MRIGKSIFAVIAAMLLWVGIADAQGIARSSNQSMASTLNAAVIADLFEQQSVTSFYVSGLTASGATLTVEGSSDGKNDTDSTKSWFAVNALPSTCPPTPFTTLTADQGIRVDTAALTNVRVRVSTAGTGTIAVSYNAIPGASLSTGACGSTGSSSSSPSYSPVPSNLVTGQVIIAVTGTAVQLATNTLVNGIVVKSKATNSASCGAIGGSAVANAYTGSGNGYGVCPGEAASFATNNSNNVYVNGTVGDIFTFEGN